MKHARASLLMSLYLDGRLDSPGARQLEHHLADCSACRRDLARLRLVVPALREADPATRIDPPDDLTERTMRRVAAYETQRQVALTRAAHRAAARRRARAAFWRGQGWRIAIVVAALVVAVGVWWRTYPESGLSGAVARFSSDTLQFLAAPGPDEIAWRVWIAGAALAVAVGGWLTRAEASAAWRRALVERLPQLW